MKKSELLNFVSRYHLAGATTSVKWIAKDKHFTYEGLDERVFGKDEELFIDGSGWVSQNGKHLMYGRTKKPIHIKNLVPELWTIKRRK